MFIKDIYYWQDDRKISGKMMLVMKTPGLSCVYTHTCVVVWCVIIKISLSPTLSLGTGGACVLCPVYPAPSQALISSFRMPWACIFFIPLTTGGT